jgi:4,5-dihydroxyphthalate decarboxylase
VLHARANRKPQNNGEDDTAMPRLQLSFACGLYDRMLALYTGDVKPDGIDLNFIAIDQPRPIFDRMSGGQEFDVAEYSSSEFVQRFANRECPFVAIPVFPSIAFRLGFIAVNRKSGTRTPKDLEGKRVGVPLYTMTAAIFINGILKNEFGVDLSKIHWVQSAMNTSGSHGSPTVLPLLKKISIENNTTGKTLGQLLAEGAIDATLGTSLPDEIRTNPDVVRLFPNYVELDKELYKRKRIYPIMHFVAIKKSVYERYPFVATSLYEAFVKSKKIALEKLFNLRAVRYMTPFLMREIDDIWEVFNGDPWPYGIEPNRQTLEALITYQQDLGLIAAPVKVDDLFVPTYG